MLICYNSFRLPNKKKNSTGFSPPSAPSVAHKHLQGWTRDAFYFWLQVFPVWQHIWKRYVTNHIQRDNSVRNTMVSYRVKHKRSFPHQGHYYIYKNVCILCLAIFMKSLSTTSFWVTRAAAAQGKGIKLSLAPEIKHLALMADAGSEIMCKLRNISNSNFLLSSLLELL